MGHSVDSFYPLTCRLLQYLCILNHVSRQLHDMSELSHRSLDGDNLMFITQPGNLINEWLFSLDISLLSEAVSITIRHCIKLLACGGADGQRASIM